MKNTIVNHIVNYVKTFDKNIKINLSNVDFTDYENKSEIYIDFKNQDITNLINSLRFDDFEVENTIVNTEDSFSVFDFYITNDVCLGTVLIDGYEREVFNVETRVTLISRNYKMVYENYLKTKEWYRIRNLSLKYSDYKCCRCGDSENLQAHHLNYNNLGNEEISDLITVCNSCHKKFHNII
tara:strand:+ start:49 stop:594 length:546 start_codon:yes stop_codon:yes gene_type:complete